MDPAASAHAAALWAGLCLILMLVLSVLVTRQRRKHHVEIGDGAVPALHQAIRAFGNATEYIPAALAGLGLLALVGAPPLLIHPIGLILFAGRVLHAVGLSRSTSTSWPRVSGVLATWIAYVAIAAALLFYAIP
ncbi:MAG: MAPEG family protein [Alphaproteobacteria bacterium]|nr:MAPEG family protein [Alphaproteobacteria bacterium]MBU1515586.1 MAPEG family protein [Alphaproteobacteria bacterium]MBU2096921.1 MAPEG family protein [Alphaproteobacteria bacterium]MBU2149576.1 MAPEG family protein [Alphaproteobacteria bacterium]MBU2305688.1 MAPEG family protein [Alphaproteobacteria bacterium]